MGPDVGVKIQTTLVLMSKLNFKKPSDPVQIVMNKLLPKFLPFTRIDPFQYRFQIVIFLTLIAIFSQNEMEEYEGLISCIIVLYDHFHVILDRLFLIFVIFCSAPLWRASPLIPQ